MGNLVDSAPEPNKIILIGESGGGKTGAKASLICAGYKIRSLDTDNGTRLLRALVTDPRYPYASIIKSRGIDLRESFHSIQIPTPMVVKSIKHSIKTPSGKFEEKWERMLVPKDAKAWSRVGDALADWKDEKLGINYGPVESWEPNTILDIDSFTTIARQAYYFNQEFNGRLGAAEEGFTHQKDVGGAQSQLRRLLEFLFNPSIRCNVILNCHIRGIDDSRGYNQTPEQRRMENPEALIEVKGFPQSVGIALSKNIPIYFNDTFVVEQRGSGTNTNRVIYTVPTSINGITISAKSSAFLKREYDQRSGLAEIFAALQYQPEPIELRDQILKYKYEDPTVAPKLKVL